MSISMCEKRRRAEREHDRVARARRRRRARESVELATRASSSSVPGSLNGIRPARTRVEPLGVLVDAEHAQPGVGERERERQPDAAEADDGDVVGHRRLEASGARRRWRAYWRAKPATKRGL